MKEDLLKIIEHYGVLKQLKYFQTEVFELNEAIINAENNRYIGICRKPCETAVNHIAEEIADVMVMLGQFINYYGIKNKDIKKFIDYKIKRQLRRIEDEKTITKEDALKKIKELEEYIESLDKELKLYDIVNYCNHEWYVIKIEEDTITLMLKDVIGTCTYSDNNYNDFAESNCIKLLNEFMKKININDLVVLDRNYDEGKFYTGLIGIPTLREIEAMPMSVRNCGEAYWTMTSSYGVSEDCDYAFVFRVYSSGNLNYDGVDSTNGVRPVIKVRRESLHE